MKFNLYIPSYAVKKRWQKYADKSMRSLSGFIQIAVEKEIQRINHKEKVNKEKELQTKKRKQETEERGLL